MKTENEEVTHTLYIINKYFIYRKIMKKKMQIKRMMKKMMKICLKTIM